MTKSTETIAGHPIHPAASILQLDPDQVMKLAADIKANGQRIDIVVHNGLVLDGRTRLAACEVAGVEPRFVEWDGTGGTPAEFVASVNLHRRHMEKGRLASYAVELDVFIKAEREALERSRANLRRGPRAQNCALGEPQGKSAERVAAIVGVSTRMVEMAGEVKRKDPELHSKVLTGDVSLSRARQTIERREQVTKVRNTAPIVGRFGLVVVDFPWSFEKRAGDDTSRGHADDKYPTMTIEEICAVDIPVLDDAVVWCWIPNAHLVGDEYQAVRAAWRQRYGLMPKLPRTWHKQGTNGQPHIGLGDWLRGQTEHAVLFVKGNPKIDRDVAARLTTVIVAPRQQHSRKPDQFYVDAAMHYPHPSKLEMYAREKRAGWTVWGAEADKFDQEPAA